MNMVYIAILVLALLGSFVLAFLSSKTWRIWPILFCVFILMSTLAFGAIVSITLKTRETWMTLHQQTKADLKVELAKSEELKYGDLQRAEEDQDSVLNRREALKRSLYDRGRIWRACRPLAIEGGGARVSVLPPNLVEGEAPKSHQMIEKMVFYVFVEALTPEGLRVPVNYLGEFQVKTVVSETEVLLTELPPRLYTQINVGGQITWSLYESMPLDSHQSFEGMSEEELQAFMPAAQFTQLGVPQTSYDKMLQKYLRDGQRADENDAPENTWLRVRFVQEYTINVDSNDEQTTIDSPLFDRNGLANYDYLRSGGEVKIKADTVVVLDQETANKLIAQGICELVEPIYLRTLNDYEHVFHKFFDRLTALDAAIGKLTRENESIAQAQQKAEAQIEFRQQELAKLQEDLTHFTSERDKITTYRTSLQAKLDQVNGRLSEVYRMNRQLVQQYAGLQQQVVDNVEKLEDEAEKKIQAKP